VGQRRWRIRVEAVSCSEEGGEWRYGGVLFGEALWVRIDVGAPLAQLGQRQLADRRAEDGIVRQHRHAVGGQVDVGLDRGDPSVERGLETGEGVLGLTPAGAAVALEVERRHRAPPRRRKNKPRRYDSDVTRRGQKGKRSLRENEMRAVSSSRR